MTSKAEIQRNWSKHIIKKYGNQRQMKQLKELKVLRVTFMEIIWKLPFFKTHRPVRKWMEYSDFVKAKTKNTATSKKINNICVVNTPARVMQCTPCTPVSLLPGCPEWGKGGQSIAIFFLLFHLKKPKQLYLLLWWQGRKERWTRKEKKKVADDFTAE